MDITEICAEVRNYFAPATKRNDKTFIHVGQFTISGKSITPLDFIAEGQYFRIAGSAMNDGVYLNTDEGRASLTDETFYGTIWEMSVPRAFLALCSDIDAWRAANEGADSANMSPYTSESFGGYSYSKGGNGSGGSAVSWQGQFAQRLEAWRKVYIE